jgi:CheY-like chemotaxis protein
MATIFIVDDEPTLHELYCDLLEMCGHDIVAEAYDGEEAVELLKTMDEPPEVVIMDHRMPGKDGIETTKELLEINPDLKIIFASADKAVKDDALALGACDFLSKPFPIDDLLIEIEELIAG